MSVTNETEEARQQAVDELDRLMTKGGNASTHDAAIASAFQHWAQQNHILLSPCFAIPRLRDGVEVSFTKFRINTAPSAKEVYKVSGSDDDDEKQWGDSTQLAFHAVTLDKIASYLGIKWAKQERADDRKNPYVCEIVQYGFYLGIDLSPQPLIGRGEIRLDDDSARAQKILRQSRNEKAGRNKLDMQRDKIVQLTETNARSRCIKSFGMRASYSKQELDKKFIICMRPVITGYSDDPEIRRMFAQDAINQSRAALSAIYGDAALPMLPPVGAGTGAPSHSQLGAATEERLALHAAPLDPDEPSLGDDEPSATPKQCNPDQCFGAGSQHVKACFAPAALPPVATQPALESTGSSPSTWVVPAGKYKGQALRDLGNDALSSLTTYYDLMADDQDLPPLERESVNEARKQIGAELQHRGLVK